jgi:plastocyanin
MTMKAKLITALMLVTACEGEPPKTPTMATNAPPAASETAAAEETTPPPATSCAPCPCQCANPNAVANASSDAAAPVVAAGDAGAVVAVADGGAPATVVAARGEITGTITTTPAYLASVSVAWLDDAPKETDRGMRGRIDNHQMTFSPMVQVITEGGSITFNNSDPFPHNVFSPEGKFNLGTIPQNSASAPKRFDKAGAFTLLCNLHPGMIGYLVVSPSSYFGKGDPKGHFRIKDVPAGTYKITAWAPRLPPVTQTVTVGAGEAHSDFELHR